MKTNLEKVKMELWDILLAGREISGQPKNNIFYIMTILIAHIQNLIIIFQRELCLVDYFYHTNIIDKIINRYSTAL